MTNIQIDREKTSFNDPTIMEYLTGSGLSDLYSVYPKIEAVKGLIEELSFSDNKRNTLVKALRSQYERTGIDLSSDPLGQRIDALLDPKCYTITTGQQIHIGLGPLYVLYKIKDVLQLAEELSSEYPEFRFQPVFWMATEDHDLEEIQDIHLYGRAVRWDRKPAGAVGRMSTEGLKELLHELRTSFNLNAAQLAFIDRLEAGYALDNLADATRYILHGLFGGKGLIVLDGDDASLKSLFVEEAINEVQGKHIEAFTRSSELLEKKGLSPQIHIRQVNLFWLGETSRERMVWKGDILYAGEVVLCERHEVPDFFKKNIYNISPNVALRPLYQELILPNLIYVGGGAEVKYWMQLKPLFDVNRATFPMLYPRSSWVLINQKKWESLNISNLASLYLPLDVLSDRHLDDIQEERQSVMSEVSHIQHAVEQFAVKFKQRFKGGNIDGKVAKILPKIQELQSIANSQLDALAKSDPEFNKLLKIKDQYFSSSQPQERSVHLVQLASSLDDLTDYAPAGGFHKFLKINHLLLKDV